MSQSVDSRPQRGLSGPCGFQGHQTQQAGLNACSQTGCWRYPHDTMSHVKLPQYSKAPFTRKKTKKKKKSMMISYTALIQTEKWRVSIVPLAGTSSELRGGWFALAAGLCSDSLSLLQGATGGDSVRTIPAPKLLHFGNPKWKWENCNSLQDVTDQKPDYVM